MRRISCDVCRSRVGSLVCDLPADILAHFRAAGSAMLCRPRQVIFGEDSAAGALYLVCEGMVKLYQSDRFGRDHILEVAGPGTLLGELSLDDADTMSVSAEALTDAQVLCLPRERLAAFLHAHPETALRFLAALSRELAVARRKVRELALKPGEGRLAGLLLQLARGGRNEPSAGRQLRLAYTRRELADMIGVSMETAVRLLAKLKRKGVIAVDGRNVVIADAERLRRIAQHEDARAAEPVRAVGG